MKMDAPVVILLLGGAAAMQALLPPLPGSPLKLPLLAAVAFYYALNREVLAAVTVGLWAGIMTDGLGGVPPGASSVFLALLAIVMAGLRAFLPEASRGIAAILGAIGASLLMMAQWLAFGPQGWSVFRGWPLLQAFLIMIPAGALATAGVWEMARHLDRMAGNIVPPKEIGEGGG